jgi:hypothetical protein
MDDEAARNWIYTYVLTIDAEGNTAWRPHAMAASLMSLTELCCRLNTEMTDLDVMWARTFIEAGATCFEHGAHDGPGDAEELAHVGTLTLDRLDPFIERIHDRTLAKWCKSHQGISRHKLTLLCDP